ncbi:MAG: hypothetical protein ACREPT_01200 [Rudaea sp.]
MLKVFLLLFLLAASGCASVPLSTMARLGSFDEADFASINPKEVLVQVQVPEEFTIDPEQTVLRVSVATTETSVVRTFPLTFVGEEVASIPSGLFSSPLRVRRQTLKLSDLGRQLFSETQRALNSAPIKQLKFNVSWKFSKLPASALSVRLWVNLQLSVKGGMFPLLKDVSIPFNRPAQSAG